jgi:flagellar biosynthesis chaperone FliJ
MIDIQKQFSEQLDQFTQYQKDAVEKLQAKTAAGVDGWEKFARYNTKAAEPEEFFNKQIDNASAFAKVVEGRTKEYIDLLSAAASTATEELQEATKENVVKAVKKSA